jgi:hypothetical protein
MSADTDSEYDITLPPRHRVEVYDSGLQYLMCSEPEEMEEDPPSEDEFQTFFALGGEKYPEYEAIGLTCYRRWGKYWVHIGPTFDSLMYGPDPWKQIFKLMPTMIRDIISFVKNKIQTAPVYVMTFDVSRGINASQHSFIEPDENWVAHIVGIFSKWIACATTKEDKEPVMDDLIEILRFSNDIRMTQTPEIDAAAIIVKAEGQEDAVYYQ